MKDFTKIDALKCPKLVRETILYLNGKVVDEATLKARSEDQIQIRETVITHKYYVAPLTEKEKEENYLVQ